MGDDGRDYRRTKPLQKLYRPGSGPLRKSSPGLDNLMQDCTLNTMETGSSRGRGLDRSNQKYSLDQCNHSNFPGTGNIAETSNKSRRNRKPQQPLYVVKSAENSNYDSKHVDNHDNTAGSKESTNAIRNPPFRRNSPYNDTQPRGPHHVDSKNFGRGNRQVSEPRSLSPAYRTFAENNFERNRDTRSMEMSGSKHNLLGYVGKPPSGRRGSSGYIEQTGKQKYMINFENLPPRLKKKFLAESGQHSLDSSIDYTQRNQYSTISHTQMGYSHNQAYSSPVVWSQTLPARGRGRLKQESEKERFNLPYAKRDIESRHSTPSGSRLNLYDVSERVETKPQQVFMSAPDSHNGINKRNMSENITGHHIQGQSKYQNQDLDSYNTEPSKTSDNDSRNSDDTQHSSNNLSDLENLDWAAEVEKDLKSERMCNTILKQSCNTPLGSDSKTTESTRKKSSHSGRRRSSRSKKETAANRSVSRDNVRDKSADRPQALPPVRIERQRLDSHESTGSRHRERERRDSHRSNRSSNLGNSRDDLDRWRSWRSYSRENSSDRRIISQCNSRDQSLNRASSPRDHDGFRVPQSLTNGPLRQQNRRSSTSSGGAWGNSRMSSLERGRSPASAHTPAPVSAPAPAPAPPAHEGGRRKPRGGRKSRRKRDPEIGAQPAPTDINWRDEIKHTHRDGRQQDARKGSSDKLAVNGPGLSKPGLLVLPQSSNSHLQNDQPPSHAHNAAPTTQKLLFDHNNPSKPIVVHASSPARQDIRVEKGGTAACDRASRGDESEWQRAAKHRPLLMEVERADAVLQAQFMQGPVAMLQHWQEVTHTRRFLQNSLQKLLTSDLKYCQSENIEHHFWKILYYNFIEGLRNFLASKTVDKEKTISLINIVIQEGDSYFENLVHVLESTYKFNVEDYIGGHHLTPPKGLGFAGLALISVQKLYLFLGDLARYKEQVNETNNYGKSKLWYTKAQQINPKNGRPYNQLAILAIYARKKLDAVYYYMRSLMSSNPFHSARESLISLFDENRKKYEAAERKRRAAREAANAGSNMAGSGNPGKGLRREVWIRPCGGRTTTLRQDHPEGDDHLANMNSVELNKEFITSYLHVHGKLITKIGMESFHESASLMLRQFRALLRQEPLPIPAARLLQLTALNMFAIETTINTKDGSSDGARSAWLECALGVSLLMFGTLLERCCALLPSPKDTLSHADALSVLPAIKAWCDWMLCHSSVWNSPPSLEKYKLGSDADPWDWLAKFMNILEAQENKGINFLKEPKDGWVAVRLSEDAAMAGFTPLMYMEIERAYAPADVPSTAAEHALRTKLLLFFGTEFLVGVDPPALRLHCPPGGPARYVSAVKHSTPPDDEPLQDVSEGSEDEECSSGRVSVATAPMIDAGPQDEATKRLLRRKEQLEARKDSMESRRLRMQEILRGGWVSVEVEVRPRWLVPDTNCFIDHLLLLQRIVTAPKQPYLLAVPLVVVTELEGLSRCSRVGAASSAALAWLGAAGPGVRFATTRGSLLASAAFTAETQDQRATNDDRVLATALSLHTNMTATLKENAEDKAGGRSGRLIREVVLLTDDRNLRVKALAAELPARDVPAFVQWASLPNQCSGQGSNQGPPSHRRIVFQLDQAVVVIAPTAGLHLSIINTTR